MLFLLYNLDCPKASGNPLRQCTCFFKMWYQRVIKRKKNDEITQENISKMLLGMRILSVLLVVVPQKENLLRVSCVVGTHIYLLFNIYLLSTFYVSWTMLGMVYIWLNRKHFFTILRELKSGGIKSVRS